MEIISLNYVVKVGYTFFVLYFPVAFEGYGVFIYLPIGMVRNATSLKKVCLNILNTKPFSN